MIEAGSCQGVDQLLIIPAGKGALAADGIFADLEGIGWCAKIDCFGLGEFRNRCNIRCNLV